jgi:hypothetical protein
MNIRRHPICLGLFLATLGCSSLALAQPTWQPQATERLVRLPADYMKKAVDRDFANSELAAALSDADSDVRLKGQTLSDIRSAIDQSEGEVKTELRHQSLVEKREYINRMGERLDLQRKHLETRKRFYQQLLKKVSRDRGEPTPQQQELIEQQTAARARFESTASAIDLKLFGSPEMEESRYAKDYAKNMTAIQRLVEAIKQHPMNAGRAVDGEALSRPELLHQLISDADAQMGILDQEATLLGYMAKLVALDALALSEEIEDAELADSDIPETTDVASTVDFFIQ